MAKLMEKWADLMDTLHQLDDPNGLEVPQNYAIDDLSESFSQLALKLSADFSTRCEVDENIQDSAQYGRIDIPEEATIRKVRIVVLVSKFSPLAMIAADNPGSFLSLSEACAEGELDPSDLMRVERALVDLKYLVIPEEILTKIYDGVAHLRFHGSEPPRWWDRFFGTF